MILWNHSFYSSLDHCFSLLTQENSSDTQGSYKVYNEYQCEKVTTCALKANLYKSTVNDIFTIWLILVYEVKLKCAKN